MLQKIVTLFIAIQFTNQECGIGCLQCDPGDQCKICDIGLKYYFKDGECVKTTIQNCQMTDLFGTCMTCEDEYQIDNGKCITPPVQYLFCKRYSLGNCVTCKKGFYQTSNTCILVPAVDQISNCEVQFNQILCGECEKGYYLSQDQKKCTIFPTVSNCHGFSNYECKMCKENYIQNKNLYLKFVNLSTNSHINNYLNKFNQQSLGNLQVIENEQCENVIITNCSVLDTFSTCKECIEGYYLSSDKNCIQNPSDIIDGCTIYSAVNQCKECIDERRLDQTDKNNKCITFTQIDQCVTHMKQVAEVSCVLCTADYYLNGESCQKRVNKIENCLEYNLSDDSCKICLENYVGNQEITNQQSTICGQVIENCQKHNFTNLNSENISTCEFCLPGFRVSNDSESCIVGSSEFNCNVFNGKDDNCFDCKEGYFNNNNTCLSHNVQDNCKTQSQSSQDVCDVCNTGFFPFFIPKQCVSYDEIQNCKVYSAPTDELANCATCDEGYYLLNNKCVSNNDSNCRDSSSQERNDCLVCFPGYGISFVDHQICKEPHAYIRDSCKVTDEETQADQTELNNAQKSYEYGCSECLKENYPYDIVNHFVCVWKDRLNTLKKDEQNRTITQVENCMRYDASYKCIKCTDGFWLKADQQECVVNCGDDTYFIGEVQGGPLNELSNINQCIQGPPGIKVLAPLINQNVDIIMCQSDTLTIQPDVDEYTNFNPNKLSTNGSLINDYEFLKYFPFLECVTDNNFNINDQNGKLESCKYYKQVDIDSYDCVRCNFGFSSKRFTTENYLLECEQEYMSTTCDSIELINLNIHWEFTLSCHKSLDDNKIPIVIYKNQSNTHQVTGFSTSLSFKNKDWNVEQGDTVENNYIFVENNPVALRTALNTKQFPHIVPNCGLYWLNVSGIDGNSFDNSNITDSVLDGNLNQSMMCAFCKPGYSPGGQNITPLFVETCIKIKHCDNSEKYNKAVNACNKCKDGYAHEIFEGVVFYNKDCVQLPLSQNWNCLAYEKASSKCKICKKGFSLNYDDRCEKLEPKRCQGRWNQYNEDLIQNNIELKFYLQQQGLGCEVCDIDYVGVEFNNNDVFLSYKQTCINNDYVEENKVYLNKSNDNQSVYIDNCESYLINQKCGTCANGYIPTENRLFCVLKEVIRNCEIAMNKEVEPDSNTITGCHKCDLGFGLVENKGQRGCLPNNISNCLAVDFLNPKPRVECTQCEPGFYLDTDNNVCKEGYVNNCKIYENNESLKCHTCETQFINIPSNVMFISNGQQNENDIERSYCYPNPENLQCSEASIKVIEPENNNNNLFTTKYAMFQCEKCTQLSSFNTDVVRSVEQPVQLDNICLPYNQVSNCEEEILGLDFSDTNFSCLKCDNASYYRNSYGYQCLQRKILPPNCVAYESNADKCKECNKGFYVSSDGTECLPNPTGIIGCRVYDQQAAFICLACDENFFYSDGKCTYVESNARISNCLYYENTDECKQCKNNFLISDGVNTQNDVEFKNHCEQIVVINCEDHISINSCRVCKQNFALTKQVNGDFFCIEYSVSGCEKFEQTEPFKCTQCMRDHYLLSDGSCELATIIPNCLYNDTQETCNLCESQYALSPDSKECVSKMSFDPNCQVQKFLETPICSTCSAGYLFVDGVCSKMSGSNGIDSGCFLTNDKEECLLCNRGYWMNSSQVCTKDDTSEVPGVQDSFGVIFKVSLVTLFALFQ